MTTTAPTRWPKQFAFRRTASDFSRTALLQFLDYVLLKGLANKNTAGALKAASERIFSDLSPEEEADLRKVDVALAAKRFSNRNPTLLSPKSLGDYQRRAEKALEEFERYQAKPTSYTGFATTSTRKRTEKSDRPSGRKAVALKPREAKSDGEVATKVAVVSSGLSFDFPLRPDFLAQIVIPRDLRAEEAKRLAAFISTLAVDFASN